MPFILFHTVVLGLYKCYSESYRGSSRPWTRGFVGMKRQKGLGVMGDTRSLELFKPGGDHEICCIRSLCLALCRAAMVNGPDRERYRGWMEGESN